MITTYRRGDPDPTPADPGPRGFCPSRDPEGWICTWPQGHPMRLEHVAGDGDSVAVINSWEDSLLARVKGRA